MPKKASAKKGAGRPEDKLLSKLTTKWIHNDTGALYFTCVAVTTGCGFVRAGNAARHRILPHVPKCKYLSAELKALGDNQAASMSLGKRNAIEASSISDRPSSIPSSSSSSATPPAPVIPKTTPTGLEANAQAGASKFLIDVTDTGRKKLKATLDHHILKLICVNGLVPHILDTDEWRDFMAAANPRYSVTRSDKFLSEHIPNEAALVRQLVDEKLKAEYNLTLTFDGNSTRQSDSIYSSHMTTADRVSYFMEGFVGSDEHHTARWIKDKQKEVRGLAFSVSCIYVIDPYLNLGYKASRRR